MAGAPPLPGEGKYQVARMENVGTARTPADLPEALGTGSILLLWQCAPLLSNARWCKGGLIWDPARRKDDQAELYLKFFMGTEDQLRMDVDPQGRTYSPCG